MDYQSLNLLDRALGLDQQSDTWPLSGQVVVIEDCVETSGSFVLHQLIKRSLSPNSSNVIIFLAFANSFSHYDRILRKLGCNLVTQKQNKRFIFFDMLMLRCPDGGEGKNGEVALISLYEKLQKTLCGLPGNKKNYVTIMIDDISLVEVAANGASDCVLAFLHYCHSLTSEFDCTLVTLNHEDIYSSTEGSTFILQMEYLADILIKAEPLSTGLATDVHGQHAKMLAPTMVDTILSSSIKSKSKRCYVSYLKSSVRYDEFEKLTVLNKGTYHRLGSSGSKIQNFHFKVKENSVDYFYPGSRV